MSLKTFISGVGTNPNFIAWNAHWGFGFFVVVAGVHTHVPLWWIVSFFTVLFGFKEFWFDKHFELAPPQSFVDNLIDFLGYMTGMLAGVTLIVVL